MGGSGSFAIFPQNRFRLVPGSALLAFARDLGVIPYTVSRWDGVPSVAAVRRLLDPGRKSPERLLDALELFDEAAFEFVGDEHGAPPGWAGVEQALRGVEDWRLISFMGAVPERIQREVQEIPADVRGSFAPGDLRFCYGLRAYAHHEGGDVIDVVACTASVSISGQGWLKDYMGMWRAMEALPVVVELRERLRPLFGETGVILEWSC